MTFKLTRNCFSFFSKTHLPLSSTWSFDISSIFTATMSVFSRVEKECLPSLFPFSMLKSSGQWCKGIPSSRARQCVPSFIYNNFVRRNARCVGGRGECVQRLTAKAWKWRADVNRASGFYLNRDHLYIMLKHLFISCFYKRTRSILFSYIAGVRAHHYRVARDR